MNDLELAEEIERRATYIRYGMQVNREECDQIIAALRLVPEPEGPIMAVEWYQGRSGKIRSAGLDWAARWIEDSAKGQGERVEEFARNMAMTIRAEAHGSVLSAAEAEGRKP